MENKCTLTRDLNVFMKKKNAYSTKKWMQMENKCTLTRGLNVFMKRKNAYSTKIGCRWKISVH